MVQTPILASIIDAGVIFLFRWSLDDTVESVLAAAVIALNSLLVNQADEVCDAVLSLHLTLNARVLSLHLTSC
jgi:hypothetical protein